MGICSAVKGRLKVLAKALCYEECRKEDMDMMVMVVYKQRNGVGLENGVAAKINGLKCAVNTMYKVLGRKDKVLFEDDNTVAFKVPNKMGDMTITDKFYQRFPMMISRDVDLYDEEKAAEYYKEIGGSISKMGYGFITKLVKHNIQNYSIFDEDKV